MTSVNVCMFAVSEPFASLHCRSAQIADESRDTRRHIPVFFTLKDCGSEFVVRFRCLRILTAVLSRVKDG